MYVKRTDVVNVQAIWVLSLRARESRRMKTFVEMKTTTAAAAAAV